jgi:hypothetical protein
MTHRQQPKQPPTPPRPCHPREAETEEEAAERKAEFERLRAEYEEEQQQREEERKRQFEKEQANYEAERNRKAEILQTRENTLNRILENAPPTFTAAQLRVFLSCSGLQSKRPGLQSRRFQDGINCEQRQSRTGLSATETAIHRSGLHSIAPGPD